MNKFRSLLMVDVMSASNIKDADGIGKSDPYVLVKFEDDDCGLPEEQQTHVLEDTLNPVWNTKLFFLVSDDCKSVQVTVKDSDVGRDKKLGHCTVLRRDAERRGQRHEEDYYLEDGDGGTVKIAIQEIDLREGVDRAMEEHKGHMEEAVRGPAQDKLLLQCRIHRAEKLKSGMVDKSDPYAKFKFDDDNVMPREARTHTMENNADPVWETVFCFLVPRALDHFQIEVMDEDVGGDDSLGHANLVMGRLAERKSDKYALSKKGAIHLTYFTVPMNGLF